MKKALRIVRRTIILLVAALIVLAASIGLLFIHNKTFVSKVIERQINKQPGLSLKLSGLQYKLFPLGVSIKSASFSMETDILRIESKIEGLKTRGDLKRLYKKRKPAFESMDLDIASVEIIQKAVSPKPVDFQILIPWLADCLAYAHSISLRAKHLNLMLMNQEWILQNLSLSLVQTDSARNFAISLSSTKAALSFSSTERKFSAVGSLSIHGQVRLGQMTSANLKLSLLDPRIASSWLKQAFKPSSLELSLDGSWNTASGEIIISRFIFLFLLPELIDLIEAEGTVFAKPSAFSWDAHVFLKTSKVENIFPLVCSYLPENYRSSQISGKLSGEAKLSFLKGDLTFGSNLSLTQARFSMRQAGIPLSGTVTASFQLRGSSADFKAGGRISGTLDELSWNRIKTGPFFFSLRTEATPETLHIVSFSGVAETLELSPLEGKLFSFEKVKLEGSGSLVRAQPLFKLESLAIHIPSLPPLKASGWLSFAGKRNGRLDIKVEGIQLASVKPYLKPFIPKAYEAWAFDGKADVALQAKKVSPSQDGLEISGGLSLTEASFHDPDFSVAGEGLRSKLTLNVSLDLKKRSPSLTSHLAVTNGECLFKNFYLDWNKNPMQAGVRAQVEAEGRVLQDLEAKLALADVGEIDLAGTVGLKPSLSIVSAARTNFDLGSLAALFLLTGSKQENSLQLAGEVKANLDIEKNAESLSIKGKLFTHRAAIENPQSRMTITDLQSEIPVHFMSSLSRADNQVDDWAGERSPEHGFVKIGRLSLPFASLDQVHLGLLVTRNSYSLEPLSFDFYGGRFEVGQTTLVFDPHPKKFFGQTSLHLKGLDLAQLPWGSAPFKISGQADFTFPTVNIAEERISFDGQGELRLFGGRVDLFNFSALFPFSRGRSISFDMDLKDLDLKKVTAAIPFGEVTGILRGEIRGLTFSYGQPASFFLKLESVPRRGVPQTFSLKAVDNLAVLSSGEKALLGSAPFWMRFIRGFRYEKIGIVSTLDNDTFTLNGTIKEEGVEYLVKKPRFFGINVINRMPDKKISFKEMMGRLSRVGRSETTSGKYSGK